MLRERSTSVNHGLLRTRNNRSRRIGTCCFGSAALQDSRYFKLTPLAALIYSEQNNLLDHLRAAENAFLGGFVCPHATGFALIPAMVPPQSTIGSKVTSWKVEPSSRTSNGNASRLSN
jgi:hypothetical protein